MLNLVSFSKAVPPFGIPQHDIALARGIDSDQ
jgi:hypothetical protein